MQGPWTKFRGSCFEFWLWKCIKFDYFCTGSPAIFYGPFKERGFRQLTFHEGAKYTLSNMVILHITRVQTLYWVKNAKETVSENQYFRRIHDIIDFIGKSYLFAQTKKQMYRVFWKISFMWEFHNTAWSYKYNFFSHDYGGKLLWTIKIWTSR